jgi:hypothetical protein
MHGIDNFKMVKVCRNYFQEIYERKAELVNKTFSVILSIIMLELYYRF